VRLTDEEKWWREMFPEMERKNRKWMVRLAFDRLTLEEKRTTLGWCRHNDYLHRATEKLKRATEELEKPTTPTSGST
jgi:hypothetical protein